MRTLHLQFRDARLLVLVTLALIGLIWATASVGIGRAWEAAEGDAIRESEAINRVLAEQVRRSVSAVDYILNFASFHLSKDKRPGTLAKLIEDGAIRMDTLVLLSHVDEQGWLRQTNNGPAHTPIDLSDREHIRVHLDRTIDGLFIGKPVRGRSSGHWSIQLTRPIIGAENKIDGVVVASLDPKYFASFWSGTREASGFHIELIGSDGVLRATSSDVQAALDSNTQRPAIASLVQTQENGLLKQAATDDGEEDTIHFRKIQDLPLIVTTSFDKKSIREAVAPIRIRYMWFAGGASICILLLGLSLSYRSAQLQYQRRDADLTRQRLRDAIEAIPDGFALYDADDRLVIFNSAYKGIYASTGDAIREGATFEEILRAGAARGQYPDAIDNLDAWVEARIAAHRTPSGPFEQLTDSGRWLRIEERRTGDGGIVGIRADITSIKDRELALARQTALLSATLEHMSEGLSVIDAGGSLVAANKRFADIFQLPESVDCKGALLCDTLAIFGQNGHLSRDPASGDAETVFRRSLEQPGKAFEWISGDDRIIELKSSRLPDGGAVTLYTDSTERRQSEQRIRHSEALKSAMVDTALDGVIVADENGIIREYNRAAEGIFAWTSKEAIGRRLSDFIIATNLFTSTDKPMEPWLGNERNQLIGRRNEFQGIDRAGRTFPVEVSLTELLLDHRRSYTAYVRNISDRKRMVETLRHARETAESANRAKSEFLTMVSHELRTPMNGIIGLTELLLATTLEKEQARFAKGVDESAKRLLVLINEILEFSRLEAGRLTLRQEPFDLQHLLDSATDTTRVLLEGKPVDVRSQTGAGIPPVLAGDATRLYQIIHNLMANSAKFTEAGEIAVRVHSREAQGSTNLLRFEISDTGPGIPSEVQARLFTPFEQGSADIASRYGGSGLGLAICRQLVELMNGKIGVTSTPGAGTTFWFELQLASSTIEAPVVVKAPPILETPTRPLRVLVAEDTPTSQLVIRTMLQRLGHTTHVVENGKLAVDALRSGTFDLVLLDLQMPVMGGLEAAREIRAMQAPKGEICIFALTAQIHREASEQVKAVGMTGHLAKPITIEKLKAALLEADRRLPTRTTEIAEISAPSNTTSVSASEGLPPRIDTAMIDDIRENVGEETFRQLLHQFTTDCSSALDTMSALLRSNDNCQDELRRHAHKLCGLLGQFGLTEAARLAEAVETAKSEVEGRTFTEQLIAVGRTSMKAM